MNRFGLAALLAIGAVCLWWQARGTIGLTDDSYQYLDAAAEVSSGECLCTRIVYWDEQLEAGRFPVPFTHFPPGYPLLIALLSRFGFSLETAGLTLSIAGFLVTIWMFWRLARGLGASAGEAFALGLLWVTHAGALSSASSIATEMPFTAAAMALAVVIVRDVRTKGSQPRLLLAIALLAGVGYWLRYAGLFLVPVAGLYIVWRAWASRRVLWAAVALSLLGAMTVSILARNTYYTGSWRGGFKTGNSLSFKKVLIETAKSFYHLVFGDRVGARADLWTILFAVSVALLIWLGFSSWRNGRLKPPALAAWLWIAAIVTFSVSGVIVAAMISVAADFTRYYLPVYPMILALLAAAVSLFPANVWRAAGLGGAVLAVLVVQARGLGVESQTPPHVVVNRALDQSIGTGGTGRDWLLGHTRPDEVILSINGQALHYVLHRPVISIIRSSLTGRPQSEAVLHGYMTKYRARYLLMFPGTEEDAGQRAVNPFLSALAGGSANPEWLHNAVRGDAVSIWECDSCVK